MLQKRLALSVVLLAGFIVIPEYTAVNGGSAHKVQGSKEWSDGSPMPLPPPKGGGLTADGSPMPLPPPKGAIGRMA